MSRRCLMTRRVQRTTSCDHLEELVVKAVGESGGYGMLDRTAQLA